ncbi:nuclear factor related to kappa-B-binding protein, related [Musa troglodytarum]|uniref:Nuclear factor related to kappa-B-binding protein, related n=1 Tax=Musa troglodytarum TaxID=320322 RepID=A0A9E7JMV5_9LILI|nr:nuclear factor related to kappa-B-binding protein, related [Musa troglodytarum]
MAILKNESRVSRTDGDSSPAGSASSREDEEEPCAGIGKAETDASDSSDVDSGMESDEFDPAELGDPGTQLCQVGNQSCSIPLDLCDLPDLGSILSLETWNECLSEEERFMLAEDLPDMDRETFGYTLKELLSGQNFHFGCPLGTLFNRLKGGLCDPRIVLYRRGLSFLQQREHYHHLCKYQNSMVRSLVGIREAWQNCSVYGIEERLRLLNILRSQKSLSHERKGDVGIEMDSESADSDDWYLNKRFKMRQQFAKPSFDITPHEIGMAREPVKLGKENSKGVLKVTAPKVPAHQGIGELGIYPSSLKHGTVSKSRVATPQLALTQQDKSAGYDMGASKRTKHHIGGDHDDMEEGYDGSQGDWIAGRRRAVTKSRLPKTGKKKEPQRRYDAGVYSDQEPEGYGGFSHSEGKSRNAEHAVTIASYGHESRELTRNADYADREWAYPTTGRAQNHMLTNPLQRNKMHEEAISSGHSVKSDNWNSRAKNCKVGNEYKAGKSKAGNESKNTSYQPVPRQMGDSYLQKDPRARILQGKMKNNMTQYDGMDVDYSSGATMISQSEETESDSSDQVEDDGYHNSAVKKLEHRSGDVVGHHAGVVRSTYNPKKPNKLMKVDKKGISDFSDAGRSIHTQDVESYPVKGKHGRLVKKALVPHPNERLTYPEKRYKGMANMDHSPQQSFYSHDYGSGVMDEYMENLDEISKSRGGKNMINKLGNMMETSDVQTIDATEERSNMPLMGCNSVPKKPKRKVDGHYLNELDESLHLQLSPEQQQIDDLNVLRKGKRKAGAETDNLTVITADLVTSEKDKDVELKAKPQKKPFTLITPTIHTGFSFSIVHLLSAVRKAMITPHMEDTILTANHLEEDNRTKQKTEEQSKMHQVVNGTHLPYSLENMDKHSSEYAGQNILPSLTVQEIVDRVRSNPGDPCILETQEPLQDLIRGVLKIFSSKTAPLGAKSWKPLVVYEKSNRSWSWAGPVASSLSDNDNAEEETSSEAWGIPHKMLVKLVDAFANWLKSGQETLQQIGSLPPPPPSLLSNLDEKERFKDLRAQKSLNTISPSSDEVRTYFRREEFLRYSVPDRAFSYTAADGKKSIVAPLRRGGGKPTSKARDHFMLKPDRPPHVTILCLVRDAAARLPGSIGTRADVCTLLRDSQYIVENISDAQVNQVVSGALDRLHYERDPCVQFDSERKLWVYLHRDREEEDFEDDGTSSTKKWKRQRKDSIDQSDIGAVNDVDAGVLAGGSSSGQDHVDDLNVDAAFISAGEKAELVSEDMRPDMENIHPLMDTTTVIKKSQVNWDGPGVNSLREKRLLPLKQIWHPSRPVTEGPASLKSEILLPRMISAALRMLES